MLGSKIDIPPGLLFCYNRAGCRGSPAERRHREDREHEAPDEVAARHDDGADRVQRRAERVRVPVGGAKVQFRTFGIECKSQNFQSFRIFGKTVSMKSQTR